MLKSQVEKVMAINPKIMIVGIDIAKKKHWARVLNFVGLEITKPFSFHNTKEDFIRTVIRLENLKKENGLEEIIVGMEPTGHYWKGLAWFLKQNGIPVVMVNPYHVKRVKELALVMISIKIIKVILALVNKGQCMIQKKYWVSTE